MCRDRHRGDKTIRGPLLRATQEQKPATDTLDGRQRRPPADTLDGRQRRLLGCGRPVYEVGVWNPRFLPVEGGWAEGAWSFPVEPETPVFV